MAERMEKCHDLLDKPRTFDSFVQSLVVQQRSFNQLLQHLNIPLGMLLLNHHMRLQQVLLERLVVNLHAHLQLDLLDLSLSAPNNVFNRVRSRSYPFRGARWLQSRTITVETINC